MTLMIFRQGSFLHPMGILLPQNPFFCPDFIEYRLADQQDVLYNKAFHTRKACLLLRKNLLKQIGNPGGGVFANLLFFFGQH